MKKLHLSIILILLSVGYLYPQSSKDLEQDFKQAESVFAKIYTSTSDESTSNSKRGYAEALPVFLKLYKKDSTNMNLAFKIGVCYQGTRRYRLLATPYLVKATSSVTKEHNGSSFKEKKAPIVAYKLLGDAYHLNYKFDKAIEAYEKFLSATTENNSETNILIAETKQSIEICKTAKVLVANPINVKIKNLEGEVKSNSGDYSPVL